jgi:hypothetical protein
VTSNLPTLAIGRHLLVLFLAVLAASAAAVVLPPVAAADPPGPTASVTHSPASPLPGEAVTFTSTSAAGSGHWITLLAWDLDNDGDEDAYGQTAQVYFPRSAAPLTVRLRVVDNHGQEAVASDVVVVGNKPPTASFIHRPEEPLAGEPISLFSTSTDPDSPIDSQSWDLDGDGSFDDASGPTASLSSPLPGSYSVGLRVVDGEGASAVARQTLVVGVGASTQVAPPLTSPVAPQGAPLRTLSPFPVVRVAGSIKRNGTRIKRFTVSAPIGATVTVRCRGRRCPFRSQMLTAAGRPTQGQAPSLRPIRVRRLERRLLRAGVIIKVFITKPGVVGKFTEFRIRRRTAPVRTDKCLVPGGTKPVPCPAL